MAVKREILERLLTDRALGALSDDVQALLSDYLAHDAEAAGLSRELAATTALAREAMSRADTRSAAALPRLSSRPWTSAGRRGRLRAVLPKVGALAACLMVGIGIGTLVTVRTAPPPQPTPRAAIVQRPVRPAEPAGQLQETPGFWSARRLYQQARRTRAKRTTPVIWDWPSVRPRIGDRT